MKLGKAAILISAGAAMAVGLSACSNAKRALGVEKISPDEFTVVTKAPLVVPPDYSLRPPQPGKNSPAYIAPDGRAQFALFGQDGSRVDGFSQGETSILEITGGAKADPNIRQIVNLETASLIEKSDSFTDQIIFWQEQPLAGQAVDAPAEAERLRENAAAGKAPNEGEVPVVEERKKAPLEGLF